MWDYEPMEAYPEDLHQVVVTTLSGGMFKVQAARLLSVSVSM